MTVEKARVALVEKCKDPVILEGVRWFLALRVAHYLTDYTTKEVAEFLMDPGPAIETMTAEQLGLDLFDDPEELEETQQELDEYLEAYLAARGPS